MLIGSVVTVSRMAVAATYRCTERNTGVVYQVEIPTFSSKSRSSISIVDAEQGIRTLSQTSNADWLEGSLVVQWHYSSYLFQPSRDPFYDGFRIVFWRHSSGSYLVREDVKREPLPLVFKRWKSSCVKR